MFTHVKSRRFLAMAAAVLVSFPLAACSTTQGSALGGDEQISDPFEGANRAVFAFNNAMDDVIIHPVAKGYNAVLPEPARNGIDNALRNLRSPVNFANQVLQGDVDGAGNVLLRAAVNTFVGLGGLFDVAGYEGYEHEYEDFGQTLGVWGIDHGPYFVVPFFGPSSMRDSTGFVVDSFADPLRWWLFNIDEEGWYYGKTALNYVALRASLVDVLEDLENSSIDYYASTRSAYVQHRKALLEDRASDGMSAPEIPDYDDDF